MKRIPLLAGRRLAEFSPSEFKRHIESLYRKFSRKKLRAIKLRPPRPPFRWSLTKKGNLSVKVNRSPLWLSREELAQISAESGIAENKVWLATIHRKKNPVRLSSQADEDQISLEKNPLPF